MSFHAADWCGHGDGARMHIEQNSWKSKPWIAVDEQYLHQSMQDGAFHHIFDEVREFSARLRPHAELSPAVGQLVP